MKDRRNKWKLNVSLKINFVFFYRIEILLWILYIIKKLL